jgi:hypothetical protein
VTVKELEAKIKRLEKKVRLLEDINEIKRLQRAYGYYVEHMMRDEIADCFADRDDVALYWLEGTWLGKEGVKRYFGVGTDRPQPPRDFLHQLMQVTGVVDVEPNGRTGKGRWYGFGGMSSSRDGKVQCSLVSGIYEIEYIKERGKWKILTIRWIIPYSIRLPEGSWGAPEKLGEMIANFKGTSEADIPPLTDDPRFLSGYIFPFHYCHPVTGKKTTEDVRNAALKS